MGLMSDLLDEEKSLRGETRLSLHIKNASVFKPFQFAETVIRCI